MIFRMLFGFIAFFLFSNLSAMLNHNFQLILLSKISILIGAYMFLYFFVFSLIDTGVRNVASFHQRYNQKNIKKTFLKDFIGGKSLVSKGYKLAFNLGFVLIVYLALKNEM